MQQNNLIVKGTRVHNLKNIDVEMPREKLTVITGLSGSGKSSLAFDTIYAEGQRRYVESLSAYARQFLGVMERPDVDYIEGLSPCISIEQKSISHNPRSTVGTVTEIYDYLRLLFARVGTQFCYNCNQPVQKQSVDQIIDAVMEMKTGTKILVLAPVVKGRKGHYRELFEEILKDGYLRVRVDGAVKEISEGMQVQRYKIHNIEVVVDRIVVQEDMRSRVAESIESALALGDGAVIINDGKEDNLYSQHLACLRCGISYDELAPNSFSFNSPFGACPECNGLGETREFDIDLIIPDDSLTIAEGGLEPMGKPRETWLWSQLRAVAKKFDFDFDTPIKKLPKKIRDIILYGSGDEKLDILYTTSNGRSVTYRHRYNGLLAGLRRYVEEAATSTIREWVESFMSRTVCATCNGARLKKESMAVKLIDVRGNQSYNMYDVVQKSLRDAERLISRLQLTERQNEIAHQIINEITTRLQFLLNVGLDYLTLDRSARTLSGGESQRIRLATQIGSQLVGVLYILDEPSIGLHQRDNIKLIDSLKHLRDLGNTVIVVEHDKEMIESADFVVDLGPGAGEHGGLLVAAGASAQFKIQPTKSNLVKDGNAKGKKKKDPGLVSSLTAQYLAGQRKI
ncbi:MAG: excinuclease ABC subunit A, partial [Bacteroidetes bacterium]